MKQFIKWLTILFIVWLVFWGLNAWFPETFGAASWSESTNFLGMHDITLPYMSWVGLGGPLISPATWFLLGLGVFLAIFMLAYFIDKDGATAGFKAAVDLAGEVGTTVIDGVGKIASTTLGAIPAWVWLVAGGVVVVALTAANKGD